MIQRHLDPQNEFLNFKKGTSFCFSSSFYFYLAVMNVAIPYLGAPSTPMIQIGPLEDLPVGKGRSWHCEGHHWGWGQILGGVSGSPVPCVAFMASSLHQLESGRCILCTCMI